MPVRRLTFTSADRSTYLLVFDQGEIKLAWHVRLSSTDQMIGNAPSHGLRRST
jgi:hypothetical protein